MASFGFLVGGTVDSGTGCEVTQWAEKAATKDEGCVVEQVCMCDLPGLLTVQNAGEESRFCPKKLGVKPRVTRGTTH